MPNRAEGFVENPDIRYKQKLREIYSINNTIQKFTGRGPNFGDRLRTFEDRMESDQTVALFSYGSNSLDDMRRVFEEKGINANFTFGGQAQLSGASLSYGSKSIARGCPVATIMEGRQEDILSGSLTLINRDQFKAIAEKECGKSMGREKGKGRYRRAVVYFDDPRGPGEEMQAVTFVLFEKHPDLAEHPIGNELNIRRRLADSSEAEKFNNYTNLVRQQQKQTNQMQSQELFGGKPLQIRWHSKEYGER